MELFGMIMSVPAAFVFSVAYAWLLNRLVWPRSVLRRVVRAVSFAILGLILLEVAVVASIGATRMGRACGPVFYVVHFVLFLLAVPSLMNVLTLTTRKSGWKRTLLAGLACAAFAFGIVLMQYVVSEALFGIG